MRIFRTGRAGKLGELIDRADKGEDILLTRDGDPIARIVPLKAVETPTRSRDEFRVALREIKERARQTADPFPGETAARSQDFLYDEDGLPQ
ncbi:type II toxin-antitoxin system Phd/YefM family antitoxin [Rhizobium glycinendophyticum]|uniref:Type II toxin-antitoxin system prevent-host-death family antitoxin n=1 Tax=Rhizobium glycinendophyticum TaxID=2589807 RepID=A0A504TVM7_9HYPH|nr:type II toxin-antitoxin system prevent-host-death family antitoxin [Rhizobium glycinendophyticum]TPP06524.1 type II toxin-antitoxin system prevent-host-death family antitoxin [Rhizobium glycinendophyticum]